MRRVAVVVAALGVWLGSGVAAADGGYDSTPAPSYTPAGSGQQDGWGFVPGLRIGSIHGTFDSTTGEQASWGHTVEVHLDALHTFHHDRRAWGISLGYLTQTSTGSSSTDPGSFDRSGISLTGILSTVVGSSRNSISARAGVVSGGTGTMEGVIEGTLWRTGIELTHVSTINVFDFASHVAVEYFTGGDAGRNFHAVAIVFGETFAIGF